MGSMATQKPVNGMRGNFGTLEMDIGEALKGGNPLTSYAALSRGPARLEAPWTLARGSQGRSHQAMRWCNGGVLNCALVESGEAWVRSVNIMLRSGYCNKIVR